MDWKFGRFRMQFGGEDTSEAVPSARAEGWGWGDPREGLLARKSRPGWVGEPPPPLPGTSPGTAALA